MPISAGVCRLRPGLLSTWILMPALLAAGCAGARPKPLAVPVEQRLTIVAERFQFIPAMIEVARGKKVVLTFKSGDRGYGIAIDGLGVKAFIPAGKERKVAFTPSRTGEFPLRCTAPATPSCRNMRGTVRVR